MRPIFKTIAKDIIVLSAQAVAFRLAAPQDQQQGIVFAAVPTKGSTAFFPRLVTFVDWTI